METTAKLESPVSLSGAVLAGDCSVGAFSYFNHGCEASNATIGRYCSIGPGVLINPGNHPTNWLSTHPFTCDATGVSSGMAGNGAYDRIAGTHHSASRQSRDDNVKIGHDVWIGARAIILGGCAVGSGAIVGAGAVVTGDVEPYSIVAGVPARHLRFRFSPEIRSRLLEIKWWDWELSGIGEHRDYSDVDGFLEKLEQGIRSGRVVPLGHAADDPSTA